MNWILNWGFLILKLIWTILSLLFLIFTFFMIFLFIRFEQNKKGSKKIKTSINWYKKFNNFCKCYIDEKKSILLYITLAIMMLGLPIAIQNNYVRIGMSLKRCINIGAPSAWLGFWGSYLGSILSISFAYINSKIEANRQKESLERQLEQSKINDLDNAIKIDEINNLTMILGEVSDYMANICSLNLFEKYPNEVIDLNTFESFKGEFSNLVIKYMKNWNKFILRCYISNEEYYNLRNLNKKVSKISHKIGNSILQYEEKINSNSDNKTLINILQEISKNLSYLYDTSEDLRNYVTKLLVENKDGIQNKQDNLDSKSKAVF
ncbi:hypothetical protein [Lactobacillus sp. M0396]|uniref:hypothetical protein n=1 Tax=Lactobacillus sp. M0396 TaxID=2751030 RepID=UPI0018DC727E|nr:hypothetical protein [Lactobacillus sp. M0396]MBI0033805.1 hypothetical protein [Lactobacillus sp. M0396]